jgi:uncharacterized protein (DUF1800 family)
MPTEELTLINPTTVSTEPVAAAAASPATSESAHLAPATLSILAAALLAACGGGGGGGSGTAATGGSAEIPAAPGFNNFPKATNAPEAARFLQQAQFSSTPTEIAGVTSADYAAWLQKEFDKPIDQTAWDWLESRGYGVEANAAKYVYNNEIGEYAVWKQLLSAPDAMRKRIALALSEFFVVSFQSMEIDWRGYTIAAYWDILNKYAFGNFRNLLEEVTLSPAMGHYLNIRGNQKEDPAKGRLPDENYAREVMQLFTIGLYELNLDGSVKTNNGKGIESYGADDVSQLARVFTGYDFDYKTYGNFSGVFPGYSILRREYARQRMGYDATKHSTLPVKCTSYINIPAGATGPQSLKLALDGLFNHPNAGPFFAKQMIQRLVTSNPSPAYVARVASAFNNNGAGVRGDLKAVWTAMLLDDEARDPKKAADVGFGKVREPIVRFVQWGRSFGVKSLQNSWKIGNQSNSQYALGQSPFQSPSVFNFFRPGYVPAGTELASRGATAPEMQLVNETTVGGYINYMSNRIRRGLETPEPTQAEPLYTNYTIDIVADYSAELALITNTDLTDAKTTPVAKALTDRLNLILCAGQMSASSQVTMQAALKGALNSYKKITATVVSPTNENYKLDWVAAGVLMTMASSDYLVQK